jgi:hypothetical protein
MDHASKGHCIQLFSEQLKSRHLYGSQNHEVILHQTLLRQESHADQQLKRRHMYGLHNQGVALHQTLLKQISGSRADTCMDYTITGSHCTALFSGRKQISGSRADTCMDHAIKGSHCIKLFSGGNHADQRLKNRHLNRSHNYEVALH